jgi:RNA polymerase sigma-70 factor (ECF subfamily)
MINLNWPDLLKPLGERRGIRFCRAETAILQERTAMGDSTTDSIQQENDLSGADERSLVQAACRDRRQFDALYERYIERIFNYLYSRLGNVQDAEDVTSQTFLAAYEALGRYRQDGYFSAWLFTIARNKAMDYYRKKKHLTDVQISEEISTDTDPLGGVIVSEQNQMLRKLIDQLPEEEKELLRLRFLAELSFASIAQMLQRSEAAVKKSTYRVLARLHNQLEDSND